MLQFILIVLAVLFAYVIIKKLASIAIKLAGGVAILGLGVTAGPPVLVGYLAERLCSALNIRGLMSFLFSLAMWFVVLAWGVLDLNPRAKALTFDTLKYALPAFLFFFVLSYRKIWSPAEVHSELIPLLQKKRSEFYLCIFSGFALLAVSIGIDSLSEFTEWQPDAVTWYVGLAYWVVAIIALLYAIGLASDVKAICDRIYTDLTSNHKTLVGSYLEALYKKKGTLSEDEVKSIFEGIAGKLLSDETVVELELGENCWIVDKGFYQAQLNQLHVQLESTLKHTQQGVLSFVEKFLGFTDSDATAFADRYLEYGTYYFFSDGSFFVAYANVDKLNVCESCGHTEVSEEIHGGLWYCSSICEKTEDICLTIKEKPLTEFVADASSNGFILIQGGLAWDTNHKLFGIGGQGHGFAAEQANNKIDRLLGDDAKVIGGNNAKNGADRLVGGIPIQTKYCDTAARSVGAAFDGQAGAYKYLDTNGKPMQLEVPKDQHQQAVKVLAKKISDGKVPGVTNPADAESMLRPGHLTYRQAVNITKFGTVESITYDLSEGAIVASVAGGISFGISASIYYLNTGDSKAALRTAAIQAGRTIGKSLTVYVTAQQLHRVAAIQGALKHINVNNFSPTLKAVAKKGLGLNSSSAASKALRGTVVTSVALIAVTTGPDLVKLVRGRISGAQFTKNLTVATSAVGGGAVGAMAGGAAGAAFGPVGIWVGQALGGMLAGGISSWLANKAAKAFMKDDHEIIMELIQSQVEFLAISFMLTSNEVDNLNANLTSVVNQNTLEVIFAEKARRRATANMFLKPIVVSIVKQRPSLKYSANEVIEACEELAA